MRSVAPPKPKRESQYQDAPDSAENKQPGNQVVGGSMNFAKMHPRPNLLYGLEINHCEGAIYLVGQEADLVTFLYLV